MAGKGLEQGVGVLIVYIGGLGGEGVRNDRRGHPNVVPLVDARLDDLPAEVTSFELDGVLMLSREGTLSIAEAVCRKQPAKVLAWVTQEETEIREKCKRGSKFRRSLGRGESTTSPEWEYEW